jgi:hypothetical protein
VRIDMDDRGTALFRPQGPAKGDGMGLGHVAAHDQDTVAVDQILLERRRSAASERGAQTGHRGGVSDARLVFDREDSQASVQKLFDQIVFFDLERRSAK